MKLILNTISVLFIGLVLVVGVLLLAPRLPVRTGIESKIVMSGSMTPTIPVGALVFVRPSTSYTVGDVITFGEDSTSAVPTTHRIVSVRTDGTRELYTTKGDANNTADSREIPKNEVIGKVFFSLPYAGFLLYFARQPLGFALLVGVPAFLVIVFELTAIAQEILNVWQARRVRAVAKPRRRWLSAQSIEYVRRFAMDDVFIPVCISHERPLASPRRYAGALSSVVAAVCISLIVSLQNTGGTLSYFRGVAVSQGNSFTAGTWNPPPMGLVFAAQGQGSHAQDAPQAAGESSDNGIVAEVPQDTGESNGGGADVGTTTDAVQVDTAAALDQRSAERDARGDRGAREQRSDNAPVVLETNASAEDTVVAEGP